MAKKKLRDIPMVAKNPEGPHSSMRVHPSQVEQANAYAKKLAGIEPFRPDGQCIASRNQFTRYINQLNKNRPDGQARLVNYDGGYGDPM